MEEIRGEHLYRVDDNGFPIKDNPIIVYFRGDELLTEIGDDVINAIIPKGILRPRWNGSEWVEDMSQEEIDELRSPKPHSPTTEERLDVVENATLMLMNMNLMGGM